VSNPQPIICPAPSPGTGSVTAPPKLPSSGNVPPSAPGVQINLVCNPFTIVVDPWTNVVINTMSSSAAIQMLTITEPTSGTNINFQGLGEGVHMKIADGLRVVLVTPTKKPVFSPFTSSIRRWILNKPRPQSWENLRTIPSED